MLECISGHPPSFWLPGPGGHRSYSSPPDRPLPSLITHFPKPGTLNDTSCLLAMSPVN